MSFIINIYNQYLTTKIEMRHKIMAQYGFRLKQDKIFLSNSQQIKVMMFISIEYYQRANMIK